MSRFSRTLLPLLLPLALAACGRHEKAEEPVDAPGRDVGTVNVTTADGRAVVKADTASGRVALDIPGFKGEITLPPMAMEGGSMDIGGVELFPGTKVEGVDVRAGRAGEDDVVTMRFSAPAAAAAVRAYFLAAFKEQGIAVTTGPDGTIAGTGKDGDPFTLAIADRGGTASAGTLVIRNKDGA
jgi:hypothetical protein